MKRMAQTAEQAPVNNALLNVVTPMGLSFTASYVIRRRWKRNGFPG